MQRFTDTTGAFRPVPRTGVIYVTTEARRLGFHPGNTEWCNLGQGQPESGALDGAPERVESVRIGEVENEYGPVLGVRELREAVAHLYNAMFRQGRVSKYTYENVAICGGGRLSLTRAAAALGQINLGHFLPDYTAYEELLDVFRSFTPIPILRSSGAGRAFDVSALREEILGRGLGALLLSNPCNPTGRLLAGETLRAWVDTSRELDCTLLVDEFYSQYVWSHQPTGPVAAVSATEFVEDVNEDPILIFDGLTKNWRYPGWRVTWAVGPRQVISSLGSAGSFLDGGACHPMQAAALPLVDFDYVKQENAALQREFRRKRELMVEGLRRLGVRVADPEGTFYCWGDLSSLEDGLDDGMRFFRRALEEKVIVVPGEFFDVNPGQRRSGRVSRFRSYVRFSFGPSYPVLEEGLGRLARMLGKG